MISKVNRELMNPPPVNHRLQILRVSDVQRHIFLRAGQTQFSEQSPLNSLLQVDKREWEAFLEKLSEFEKKYELLLGKMDAIQGRLQAERKRDEEDKSPGKTAHSEASVAFPERQIERTLRGTEDRSLLGFGNKAKPRNGSGQGISQTAIIAQKNPSCTNCGSPITRPARFCKLCGFSFGKLVCSCGRVPPESSRFCDGCGTRL